MLELGGVVVSVLDRLDREDVRLLPLRRVSASAVGLRWVRRQHSPLSLLCITRSCECVGNFLKLLRNLTVFPGLGPLYGGNTLLPA